MIIHKIGVEMEGGIIDEDGFAKFTTIVNGQEKKIFDLIHQSSPKDLQAQMKPEIFSNMVELVTHAGTIQQIKKEAVQLRQGLEDVTNRLGLILSRKVIYPVRKGSKQVISREEIYEESFNKVRGLNPAAEFNARTLGLHLHMSGNNDDETIALLFALNNHYASIRGDRESNPSIMLSKERFDARKVLVETRNILGEVQGGVIPTHFKTKDELLKMFFGKNHKSLKGGFPSPIQSHRMVTLKKPGEELTAEDRHADSPLCVEKIPSTINTIIENAHYAEKFISFS